MNEENVTKRIEDVLDDVIPDGTIPTGWSLVVTTLTPDEDGDSDGIWIAWNTGAQSYHTLGLLRSAQVHLENDLI